MKTAALLWNFAQFPRAERALAMRVESFGYASGVSGPIDGRLKRSG